MTRNPPMQCSRRSLGARAGILTAALLVTAGLVAPVAWLMGGWPSVAFAAIAGGICLATAYVALLLRWTFGAPQYAVPVTLLVMMVRMGIPLFTVVGCQIFGGPLANVALLYYLLVFFPVMLAMETIVSAPRHTQMPGSHAQPGNSLTDASLE
jgi:hypothetical protein